MIRFFTLLTAAFILFASPSTGWAQPTGDELARYEDYLQRGSKAFESREFETALLLFGKAQEIHDHPRLRFSMARIYEELEQCVAAKMMYVILMENDGLAPELRKEAGMRLADIETCGVSEESGESGAAEAAASAHEVLEPPVPVQTIPIETPARPGRELRNLGVWSIGTGAGLTLAGLVFATTVLVPEKHRRCYGLGVTIDDQIAACERLAADEQIEFFEAHVESRKVVQTHRVTSTALISAGIVGSGLGLGLLFADRSRHVALQIGPGSVGLALAF